MVYKKSRYHENLGEKNKIIKKEGTRKIQKNNRISKKMNQENPVLELEYNKRRYQEKKRCDKVKNFPKQVKQGPHYICTICHRSLYQCSFRLFKPKKYHILNVELYHSVKPIDKKCYIYETCHNHLNKDHIACQAVYNKMTLDSRPIEKVLICKTILLKKIATMFGKADFFKIKGSICHTLIEAAKICSVLPMPAVCNKLIVVKLKRDLKYKGSFLF